MDNQNIIKQYEPGSADWNTAFLRRVESLEKQIKGFESRIGEVDQFIRKFGDLSKFKGGRW